jgi:hypothetical protein
MMTYVNEQHFTLQMVLLLPFPLEELENRYSMVSLA